MSDFVQDDSQQFARLLLKDGLIRQEDWQIAESIQHVQGGRLLEILLGLCPLSEEDLYRAISRQLDYPFWTDQDLVHFHIPDDLLLRFPVSIALECDFLPIKWDEYHRRLHIVLSNPLDKHTLDAITMYAQADELVIGISAPSNVVNAIQVHYKQSQGQTESIEMEPSMESSEAFFPVGPSSHAIPPPKIQLRECPACHNMEPVDVDTCSQCTSPMDLASSDLFLGKVVKGFQLTHKLGEGGMGLVYGAKHTESRQEAAVKILRTHLSSNERVVRRFHREAQAQNQLRHPNIVQVHDFGFEAGLGFFIAMEFLRGMSLEEIFEEHIYKLTPRFVRQVLQQVCDAMGLAHSRGIYHRDLKPDNIFLLDDAPNRGPHIKVLDFGVAKMVASEEDERLTRTGMTIGTPRYMAPEQAGDGNTDHRSDIYSLGVIMFEMLTGKPPFEGSSAYQIMLRHVYADPPALTHLRPDLPFFPEFEDFCMRVLAKDPQLRPASMDLFWQELSPLFDRFESYLPLDEPLHGSYDDEPQFLDEVELDPGLTTEPPVLIGRLAPEETVPPPARNEGAAIALDQRSPNPTPAPNWISPSNPSQPGMLDDQGWLDNDDLELWESNIDGFGPPAHANPLPSSILPNELFDAEPPLAPAFRPFSTMPEEEPPESAPAPFQVPEYKPNPEDERPPLRSKPIDVGSPLIAPSTPKKLLSMDKPKAENSAGRGTHNISLRSGKPNQRNRFSNALKKQSPAPPPRSRYFLMFVLALLLFGGGLLATWFFLKGAG